MDSQDPDLKGNSQSKSQKPKAKIVLLTGLLLLGLTSCSRLEFLSAGKLTPRQLAIVVNEADPLSLAIARYYQQQRQIPPQNVISVRFNPHRTAIPPAEFQEIKAQVDAQTPPNVQAFALTWASPYRTGCLSITSAFAVGFSTSYCGTGCSPTPANPYFNSNSSRPYDDFRLRPTMAIAASNFPQGKALIDRGVRADGTRPGGTAYLLDTSDRARNVRSRFYSGTAGHFLGHFAVEILKANALEGRPDVMFYFTGTAEVEKLATNRFLPGAAADHLTSFGGQLTDSKQMSSLRWLEAGATGSYGTVVEPCNFPQKFPHPGILMKHYLQGETLMEAYWKSVAWLGQGIFIGEPLARPFAPAD